MFLSNARGLSLAAGLFAGVLTAPAVAAAGTLPGGTVPATYGSAAVVKVSAGGHELSFIVDTGASTSAITATAAKTLGLVPAGAPQKVSTIGCSTSTRYAPITGWRVGKVALPTTQIGILHSSLSSKTAHSPTISGLLGSDVLSQFGRVTFDLAHQQLILGGHPVAANAGIPMMVLHHDAAVEEAVRATINGHAARFILDTGSPLTLLQASAAKRFGLISPHVSIKVHGAGGCSIKARVSEIVQWNAGGEPLPSTVAITTSGPGSGLSSSKSSPAGLIGAGTLFGFGRLEMDFARGRLVFGSPAK